jgi:hypothetical protein
MALLLEQRFKEITRGKIKSVIENSSFFGKSAETKYVFKNHKGKRSVLKIKTHLGYDGNPAQIGDLITVSSASEGFFQIEIGYIKRGETPKKRYTYYCPSSEVELS